MKNAIQRVAFERYYRFEHSMLHFLIKHSEMLVSICFIFCVFEAPIKIKHEFVFLYQNIYPTRKYTVY